MNDGYLLRVTSGPSAGEMIALDRPVIVGRDGDLKVADSTISRHHLQISPGDTGPMLVDLESAGGTTVNGTFVQRAELSAGDRLKLGRTDLMVLRLIRYSDAAASHALRVLQDGKSRAVALRDGMVIGRDTGSDISVLDPTVSRRHASLHVDAHGVSIDDLDSANGTRVNGELVERPLRLVSGAQISLGKAAAKLSFHTAPAVHPMTLRVVVEATQAEVRIEISADSDSTIAQVTAELGRAVNSTDQQLVLYRPDTGVLYHPDDFWHSTGIATGDSVLLGSGDATAFRAASGRTWPERHTARINQLPRAAWPPAAHTVGAVEIPESTSLRGRGVVWQIAGGLGAVLIGLTLAIVNPSYAIFGLITGGIGIVSIAASILGDQSRRRFKEREFLRRLRDLERELDSACATQSDSLRNLYPTTDEIESRVEQASARLWERRPDHDDALHLRIGSGRRATRLNFEGSRGDDPRMTGLLNNVMDDHGYLDAVPVTIPGNRLGSIGVAGPPSRTRALLQRMTIEASTQHSPDQLSIWVAAVDESWNWCRWLPHASAESVSASPSEVVDVMTAFAIAVGDSAVEPNRGRLHLLIVPDSAISFDLTKHLASNARSCLTVVAAPESHSLPSGLASVISISEDGDGSLTGDFADSPVGDFKVEGITDTAAERIAIGISRVGGRTASQTSTGLIELLGLGSVKSLDVEAAWNRTGDRLTVPVGSDDSGELVTVGLRRDGPHAMIAGTTGSGKSELLQTILAAEVLRHRPEQLNLFLIDFKGGATFSPLARLPHVVGLVTDLEHDGSLAARAFTSLDAEIARRKQLLDNAGVADISAYERRPPGDATPLANLVVVIDEFALLVERQPEVKERLDTIATQGRSLGIHMILATQSPSGVITNAIRTNTNLWICLRVVTDSESVEILGNRAAARISDRSPGRAILRRGAGTDLREFQAARIGQSVQIEDSPVSVRLADSPAGFREVPSAFGLTTELEVVVDRVVEAADRLCCETPTPLWLESLPTELSPGSLSGPDYGMAGAPVGHLCATVGMTDDPSRHAQYPHVVDLSASGHMLVVGVFGSGKSTALRQVAHDLSRTHSPDQVHIYAIDGGAGDLRGLADLPQVGDVVPVGDTERLTRLIDRLARAVNERRESSQVIDGGGFLAARAEQRLAWNVLLVDDFPAFREAAEGVENGRLLERFNSLLQNGPPVGIHVVISTTQSVDLRTRELNLLQARLILQSGDASDYALADPRFNPSLTPPRIPGRGLIPGLLQVQVAVPGQDDAAELAKRWPATEWSSSGARPIRRLPRTVSADDVKTDGPGIPLGLGGAEVQAVSIELSRTSPILLIAGPRQSGRTSTLAHIREHLIRDGSRRSLVLAPRPGPWSHLPGGSDNPAHRSSTPTSRHEIVGDPDRFVAEVDDILNNPATSSLLVIDDAEALSSVAGLADRLDRIVRRASETDTLVVVGARVNDLPGMFDPWARYVVSLRRALLLSPSSDDLFLFGQKLLTVPESSLPGRGVLVDGPMATALQVVEP